MESQNFHFSSHSAIVTSGSSSFSFLPLPPSSLSLLSAPPSPSLSPPSLAPPVDKATLTAGCDPAPLPALFLIPCCPSGGYSPHSHRSNKSVRSSMSDPPFDGSPSPSSLLSLSSSSSASVSALSSPSSSVSSSASWSQSSEPRGQPPGVGRRRLEDTYRSWVSFKRCLVCVPAPLQLLQRRRVENLEALIGMSDENPLGNTHHPFFSSAREEIGALRLKEVELLRMLNDERSKVRSDKFTPVFCEDKKKSFRTGSVPEKDCVGRIPSAEMQQRKPTNRKSRRQPKSFTAVEQHESESLRRDGKKGGGGEGFNVLNCQIATDLQISSSNRPAQMMPDEHRDMSFSSAASLLSGAIEGGRRGPGEENGVWVGSQKNTAEISNLLEATPSRNAATPSRPPPLEAYSFHPIDRLSSATNNRKPNHTAADLREELGRRARPLSAVRSRPSAASSVSSLSASRSRSLCRSRMSARRTSAENSHVRRMGICAAKRGSGYYDEEAISRTGTSEAGGDGSLVCRPTVEEILSNFDSQTEKQKEREREEQSREFTKKGEGTGNTTASFSSAVSKGLLASLAGFKRQISAATGAVISSPSAVSVSGCLGGSGGLWCPRRSAPVPRGQGRPSYSSGGKGEMDENVERKGKDVEAHHEILLDESDLGEKGGRGRGGLSSQGKQCNKQGNAKDEEGGRETFQDIACRSRKTKGHLGSNEREREKAYERRSVSPSRTVSQSVSLFHSTMEEPQPVLQCAVPVVQCGDACEIESFEGSEEETSKLSAHKLERGYIQLREEKPTREKESTDEKPKIKAQRSSEREGNERKESVSSCLERKQGCVERSGADLPLKQTTQPRKVLAGEPLIRIGDRQGLSRRSSLTFNGDSGDRLRWQTDLYQEDDERTLQGGEERAKEMRQEDLTSQNPTLSVSLSPLEQAGSWRGGGQGKLGGVEWTDGNGYCGCAFAVSWKPEGVGDSNAHPSDSLLPETKEAKNHKGEENGEGEDVFEEEEEEEEDEVEVPVSKKGTENEEGEEEEEEEEEREGIRMEPPDLRSPVPLPPSPPHSPLQSAGTLAADLSPHSMICDNPLDVLLPPASALMPNDLELSPKHFNPYQHQQQTDSNQVIDSDTGGELSHLSDQRSHSALVNQRVQSWTKEEHQEASKKLVLQSSLRVPRYDEAQSFSRASEIKSGVHGLISHPFQRDSDFQPGKGPSDTKGEIGMPISNRSIQRQPCAGKKNGKRNADNDFSGPPDFPQSPYRLSDTHKSVHFNSPLFNVPERQKREVLQVHGKASAPPAPFPSPTPSPAQVQQEAPAARPRHPPPSLSLSTSDETAALLSGASFMKSKSAFLQKEGDSNKLANPPPQATAVVHRFQYQQQQQQQREARPERERAEEGHFAALDKERATGKEDKPTIQVKHNLIDNSPLPLKKTPHGPRAANRILSSGKAEAADDALRLVDERLEEISRRFSSIQTTDSIEKAAFAQRGRLSQHQQRQQKSSQREKRRSPSRGGKATGVGPQGRMGQGHAVSSFQETQQAVTTQASEGVGLPEMSPEAPTVSFIEKRSENGNFNLNSFSVSHRIPRPGLHGTSSSPSLSSSMLISDLLRRC
uniref:Uncharacterized protein n=1 Tax=Chromera velia CCMP2878 TaxID=1169474 RepID=A0A0G4FWY1_9ALVE|eukprot:Cvel_19206.t1-p1 / transcript=Cvel_19206.t1 / gene=Cvel_19206 / organism=Chromera_velia_CCMP2878 / gene_product=hypothetical protein / transcript_product=hypothetical protein / location=Cvel_scaffold1639:19940-37646(-) / protein_length=1592 / sequence_SO=supercontig / SO=protein_coding / is_pseudo=false